MTATQLAALFPFNRNGELKKPILPRKDKAYVKPGSYTDTIQLLRRMQKTGDVKGHEPPHRILPWIWTLPGEHQLKQYFNLQHELDCADLFVKYFSYFDDWQYNWETWERVKYNIGGKDGQTAVYYDRRLKLTGLTFFIEVDRGTEPLGVDPDALENPHYKPDYNNLPDKKTIKYKIAQYLRLAELATFPFVVVFTIQDWRYGSYDLKGTELRLKQFIALTRGVESKALFVVADHRKVLESPTEEVFFCPLLDKYVSLFELTPPT